MSTRLDQRQAICSAVAWLWLVMIWLSTIIMFPWWVSICESVARKTLNGNGGWCDAKNSQNTPEHHLGYYSDLPQNRIHCYFMGHSSCLVTQLGRRMREQHPLTRRWLRQRLNRGWCYGGGLVKDDTHAILLDVGGTIQHISNDRMVHRAGLALMYHGKCARGFVVVMYTLYCLQSK